MSEAAAYSTRELPPPLAGHASERSDRSGHADLETVTTTFNQERGPNVGSWLAASEIMVYNNRRTLLICRARSRSSCSSRAPTVRPTFCSPSAASPPRDRDPDGARCRAIHRPAAPDGEYSARHVADGARPGALRMAAALFKALAPATFPRACSLRLIQAFSCHCRGSRRDQRLFRRRPSALRHERSERRAARSAGRGPRARADAGKPLARRRGNLVADVLVAGAALMVKSLCGYSDRTPGFARRTSYLRLESSEMPDIVDRPK